MSAKRRPVGKTNFPPVSGEPIEPVVDPADLELEHDEPTLSEPDLPSDKRRLARVAQGRSRLLLVLPRTTVMLLQHMAGELNATYSSVVHMAIGREFVENPHLRHQREIDRFVGGQEESPSGSAASPPNLPHEGR